MITVLFFIPQTTQEPLPELGVASLVATLKKMKVSVSTLIINAYNIGLRKPNNIEDPTIICVSFNYTTHHNAYLKISLKLRKWFPDSLLICGGHHVTLYPTYFLGENMCDIAVIGEGEQTLSNIIDYFRNESQFHTLRGINYYNKKTRNIICNPIAPLIKVLDDLPYPDFKSLPFDIYEVSERKRPSLLYKGRLASWVFSQRGCAFGCSYCSSVNVMGTKVRMHSPDYLIKMISDRLQTFPYGQVFFFDDNFSFNRKWVLQLCKLLKINYPTIIWGCQTRFDLLDNEMIKIMSESGCRFIELGIESYNPNIRFNLGKSFGNQIIDNILQSIKINNIVAQLNFMIGTPFDTFDSIKSNIKYGHYLLNKFCALPCYWAFSTTSLDSNEVKSSNQLQYKAFENMTPFKSYISNSVERNKNNIFYNLLLEAWEMPKKPVEEWFKNNQLLKVGLGTINMSLEEYLSLIFTNEIGSFKNSAFFV